jgi:hypothetical protein
MTLHWKREVPKTRNAAISTSFVAVDGKMAVGN